MKRYDIDIEDAGSDGYDYHSSVLTEDESPDGDWVKAYEALPIEAERDQLNTRVAELEQMVARLGEKLEEAEREASHATDRMVGALNEVDKLTEERDRLRAYKRAVKQSQREKDQGEKPKKTGFEQVCQDRDQLRARVAELESATRTEAEIASLSRENEVAAKAKRAFRIVQDDSVPGGPLWQATNLALEALVSMEAEIKRLEKLKDDVERLRRRIVDYQTRNGQLLSVLRFFGCEQRGKGLLSMCRGCPQKRGVQCGLRPEGESH